MTPARMQRYEPSIEVESAEGLSARDAGLIVCKSQWALSLRMNVRPLPGKAERPASDRLWASAGAKLSARSRPDPGYPILETASRMWEASTMLNRPSFEAYVIIPANPSFETRFLLW